MLASDVITIARRVLGDEGEGGNRWSDEDLLDDLSDAQRMLYNQQPSLFLASGDTMNTPVELTALTDTMKVGEESRPILVNFVVAAALTGDSDDARNWDRAEKLRRQAENQITGTPNG